MDTTSSRYNDALLGGDLGPNGDTPSTDGGAMTIAAAFPDRDGAHGAAHRLHDEGFHDSWIGITRTDDGVDYRAAQTAAAQTRVESDNWFMRFFGEGDESLHDVLVRHGVSEADASAVGELPAQSAILIVDGSNHPELAAQIVAQSGGRLITRGAGGLSYGNTTNRMAPNSEAPAARTTSLYDEGVIGATPAREYARAASGVGSGEQVVGAPLSDPQAIDTQQPDAQAIDTQLPDAASYDDYGRFRAGKPVDESTRLQLREERLRVDKSRISRGEATIGTEVVTEAQEVDVPLIREELFIERRPARAAAAGDGSPIGSNETVRIPLSQEQVTITKVPVVTEEIVIGKREVETIEHVSETVRKEQLKTDDVQTNVTANPRN